MALRDHLAGQYLLSLFAGVRTATTAPPGTYNPGTLQGSGVPGGIGAGDGGFNTPADASITTPTVLYPSAGTSLELPSCATITSSTFSATGGQTHVATRWMIEMLDDGEAVGYVYDSGADGTLLTDLPIATLGLQNGSSFKVYVRYKGSNNVWSDWGTQEFTRAACGDDDTCSTLQTLTQSFDPNALATHAFTLPIPAAYRHWPDLKVYLVTGSWDDSGSITGTETTIEPTPGVGGVTNYLGPEVLLSVGNGDLTGSVTNTNPGGCTITMNLRFESTVNASGCPGEALPPSPPPGPPAPPPPPPPAPAPAPAPDTPAGQAQMQIDWSNSFLWVSMGCGFVYKFTELAEIGGAVSTGGPMRMGITVQNLSPSTAGNTSITVTSDNTNMTFDGQTQDLAVPAGGHATAYWRLYPNANGTYTVSITSPQGHRDLRIVAINDPGCPEGLGGA